MSAHSRESIAAALASFERVEVAVDERRAAAVAVAVVEDANGLGVLLTRRAQRMRAHPGQWALPGGRIDDGEDFLTAAIREMDEELGLRVDPAAALGLLDDYPTRSGYVITPVVVWAGSVGQLRPNPDEVASVHVAEMSVIDVEPRFVMIPESDAPVIQLPMFDTLLHAPTAAVLHQFREVALHGRATRVAHFEQPVFAWR
jgi:8-oxo-dGTP pyrophosphatase MutT (NUDIX family)